MAGGNCRPDTGSQGAALYSSVPRETDSFGMTRYRPLRRSCCHKLLVLLFAFAPLGPAWGSVVAVCQHVDGQTSCNWELMGMLPVPEMATADGGGTGMPLADAQLECQTCHGVPALVNLSVARVVDATDAGQLSARTSHYRSRDGDPPERPDWR